MGYKATFCIESFGRRRKTWKIIQTLLQTAQATQESTSVSTNQLDLTTQLHDSVATNKQLPQAQIVNSQTQTLPIQTPQTPNQGISNKTNKSIEEFSIGELCSWLTGLGYEEYCEF